ncbi:hypothetical protein Y032_0029g1919 [Ancylostoma ceylanicum]|uniref:Uncharacterized protein n=1 Tax=Ancylostoma ceylanicum TaxID=53326 RepID=A0A016UTQ1_9BILA|nr:hypothetical protein Y032_0029g1919 [Ancylostoma ceylanicum]
MSEEPSDRALLEQMERELLRESPPPDKPSTEGPTEDTRRRRTRGRRSRNRCQRCRHESSGSSRSIFSPSSGSSENSDMTWTWGWKMTKKKTTPLICTEEQKKQEEASPLCSVHELTSPLEEPRVPKRIEFACSIREASDIAGLEKKVAGTSQNFRKTC